MTTMKQTRLLLLAVLCLLVASVAKADDTPIPVGQLPAAARTFVQANFPTKKIIYAEKDFNMYECRLSDGTEIDFNKKGNWDKVDCKNTAVPAALIPEAIKSYVKANFPDCIITKIDKERYGIDIELSNDLDLKFNYQGQLLGMDD